MASSGTKTKGKTEAEMLKATTAAAMTDAAKKTTTMSTAEIADAVKMFQAYAEAPTDLQPAGGWDEGKRMSAAERKAKDAADLAEAVKGMGWHEYITSGAAAQQNLPESVMRDYVMTKAGVSGMGKLAGSAAGAAGGAAGAVAERAAAYIPDTSTPGTLAGKAASWIPTWGGEGKGGGRRRTKKRRTKKRRSRKARTKKRRTKKRTYRRRR